MHKRTGRDTVGLEMIHLGAGARLDEGVCLGYLSPRDIPDPRLIIGGGARIRRGSVIYAGSHIGERLATGHNSVIREENQIGDDFCLWSNSVVDYGCRIGSRVKIHTNCYVSQFSVIEDDAFLAPGVSLANDPHPGCPMSRECMRGPHIGRGASLGVNVTVLPFVKIGEGCLIGAGCVVVEDVPPRSVVVGNPGRIISRTEYLKCRTGLVDRPYAATGRLPLEVEA
ncbi:MAG: acyltransferase [Pseudomonadota bacterium]